MQRPGFLSVLVLLTACSGRASPPPPPPPAPPVVSAPAPPAPPALPVDPPPPAAPDDDVGAVPRTVTWELVITPSTLTMAQVSTQHIRVVATNHGTAAANLYDERLSFLVNGQSSMALDMAFGNGGHAAEWTALPPGQTARDERIGIALYRRPDIYAIVLLSGDEEVGRALVRVTADSAPPTPPGPS